MDESTFLKEGYSVYIDDPYEDYYRIVRREPFQYVTGAESPVIFTSVLPGAQSGDITIPALEPDNDPLHLFQILWGVDSTSERVKYYVKIPTGQNRFGIDQNKSIGYVTAIESPYFDPNPLFQFWLVHDWIPSINCVNNSPVAVTPKIYFRGMKYDIEKIANPGTIVKKIVFGGIKNTP